MLYLSMVEIDETVFDLEPETQKDKTASHLSIRTKH
jgi:hypothetical protein